MPPRPSHRLAALSLELAGAAAVVAGVALWRVPLAVVLAGVLLITAAQFLDELV